MTTPIHLHIDELVLTGLGWLDRRQLAAAVEGELTRLLAEGGAPAWLAAGGSLGRLEGGSFEVRPNAGAAEVGAQVARTIYGGLARR